MRFSLLSLFTVPLLLSVLTSRSQSKIDTASWLKVECIRNNYLLKSPPNYLMQNECGLPYKMINGSKTFPFRMNIENYKLGYHYSSSKQINNLSEWINWRAGVIYSADGPDASIFGDSIAKVSWFTNKYGINITELYVYVRCSMMEAEGRRDYVSICGPVFALKLNLPKATEESVLFLRPNEWDVTNDENVILRLMVENINYLYNY